MPASSADHSGWSGPERRTDAPRPTSLAAVSRGRSFQPWGLPRVSSPMPRRATCFATTRLSPVPASPAALCIACRQRRLPRLVCRSRGLACLPAACWLRLGTYSSGNFPPLQVSRSRNHGSGTYAGPVSGLALPNSLTQKDLRKVSCGRHASCGRDVRPCVAPTRDLRVCLRVCPWVQRGAGVRPVWACGVRVVCPGVACGPAG